MFCHMFCQIIYPNNALFCEISHSTQFSLYTTKRIYFEQFLMLSDNLFTKVLVLPENVFQIAFIVITKIASNNYPNCQVTHA